MSIRLSKSQLDKFVRCPRCFWLGQRKLKEPDMISSKVWKGIERVTIGHFEKHRLAKTTPTDLVGQVPEGGIPYQADRISLKDLRYSGKGLAFVVEGVTVTTALDDMLQWPDGGKTRYAVLDYKSKSRATDEAATADLYANQADVYDLACNVNDYPTNGEVYFVYSYPISITESQNPLKGAEVEHGLTTQLWGSQVITLRADHDRIKKLVLAAAACIDSKMPEPNVETQIGKRGGKKMVGCPVCIYLIKREEFDKLMASDKVRA